MSHIFGRYTSTSTLRLAEKTSKDSQLITVEEKLVRHICVEKVIFVFFNSQQLSTGMAHWPDVGTCWDLVVFVGSRSITTISSY